MLSKSMHIGRLTRDPELKEVEIRGEKVKVANFAIACDPDRGEGQADFYNVVVWRGLAETVGKYLTKGRLVYVEGRARTRSYPTTKDGVEFTNYITETNADRVDFLDTPKNAEDRPAVAVGGAEQEPF